MVFFHETLDSISQKAKEGKIAEAKRILDTHITSEHHFQSEVAGLQGALNSFTHELRELQSVSEQLLSRKTPSLIGVQEVFEQRVYNAKLQLTKVEALIIKLRKEAKLNLR